MSAATHNYEDLHILVDLLRPAQADAVRVVVLQLVDARPGAVETTPMPTGVTPDDEGTGRRRYRRLSFAGSISAEPDLAERSEEILAFKANQIPSPGTGPSRPDEWPPPWFGSVTAGEPDIAERTREILRAEYGRS